MYRCYNGYYNGLYILGYIGDYIGLYLGYVSHKRYMQLHDIMVS